jgi:hypothetical protein
MTGAGVLLTCYEKRRNKHARQRKLTRQGVDMPVIFLTVN